MDLILLMVTLMLILVVLILRLRSIRQEKRRRQFYKVWDPLLEQSMEELPGQLPKLDTADIINYLVLWNGMQDNLVGEVKDNLNQVARQSKIDVIALKHLLKGGFAQRLLSIKTVGHLREAAAWDTLQKIVQTEQQQLLVLAAAKSMAEIDEWQAAEVFIPLIVTRKEWPAADVAAVLEKLKPEAVAEVLCKIILRTLAVEVPRLLRYLRFATPSAAVVTALTLFKRYNSVEIIAGCLSVLADCDHGKHIEVARNYATHSSWVVRLQAINVLSKIGTREDVPLLLGMLTDREWWVRYRSARALVGLTFLTMSEIERMAAAQTDKYAIDALNQALMEKRIVS